jgi:hypothetical protein
LHDEALCWWHRNGHLLNTITKTTYSRNAGLKVQQFEKIEELIIWPVLLFPVHKQHNEIRPCNSSGDWSPGPHRGDPGLRSGQSMWDLWWIKWH